VVQIAARLIDAPDRGQYRQAPGASPDSTREGGNIGDGRWFYLLADRQCGLAGRASGPGHPHPPNPLSGAILSRSNMSAFEARRIAVNIANLPKLLRS
jgi:hypothetical protein